MTRDQCVSDLCKLQAIVARHMWEKTHSATFPADCFCWDKTEGGLDGTNKERRETYFRNEGIAIRYIIDTVLDRVIEEGGTSQGLGFHAPKEAAE